MVHHQGADRGLSLHGSGPAGRSAFALVLVIALICGAVAAGMLWSAGAEADRELAVHRHQVTATTTERAKEQPVAARYGAEPQSVAPAVWEYPRDVRRSGTVSVPPRTPEGHTLTIWVDDSGVPARGPGGAADRSLTSLAGGAAVAGAVGTAGAGVLFLVRRRSEAHSLEAWEQEWEQVEPVWSGRLRRGGGAPGNGDD
ncbi:hypothetical protein [Streptomyces sp. NPDC013457]|uniref:Rv1733c family protein n=1 Tax=Streptomyces sp. NPDC013457 TaxID=3364866 RepID=UPI0036F89A5C